MKKKTILIHRGCGFDVDLLYTEIIKVLYEEKIVICWERISNNMVKIEIHGLNVIITDDISITNHKLAGLEYDMLWKGRSKDAIIDDIRNMALCNVKRHQLEYIRKTIDELYNNEMRRIKGVLMYEDYMWLLSPEVYSVLSTDIDAPSSPDVLKEWHDIPVATHICDDLDDIVLYRKVSNE